MKAFGRLVTGHPWVVFAALALASLVSLHGLVDLRSGRLRIEVDPSIARLWPEGDDERAFYDRAKAMFGSDQFLMLVLETEDAFGAASLDRLQRITKRLERLPRVHRVLSLANASEVVERDGGLHVGPFFEKVPAEPEARAALRERVALHPLYGPTLVSSDGRAAAVLVSFDVVSTQQFEKRRLCDGVARAAVEEPGEGRVLMTGMPHLKLELSRMIHTEIAFIVPSVLAISVLLSAFAFRTVRGVVLPTTTIAVAVLWTLGSMGWAGKPFDLLSNIVPPLVITLGFATGMHVVSEYYELLHHHLAPDHEANRAAVVRVFEEMGIAVAANGLTTVLGFGSVMVSGISAVREFGFWSCVGVIAVTLLSLTLIPAALVLLGPPKRLPRRPAEDVVDRSASAVADFAVRRRAWLFGSALVLLLLCGIGIARVRISTGLVDSLREDLPVRVTFEEVSRRFRGLNSFFVVVDADENGAFMRPENLAALRGLQDWLEQQPEIGHTASLADPVRILNRAFEGNAPEALAIPARASQVEQLLRFGGDDATRGFVDPSYSTANVVVRTRVSGTGPIGELLARIDARLQELPQRLRARVTGEAVLLRHTVDHIALGELQSIGTAMITIYLVLSLLLTSFRVGLFALLPNVLPIAIYFGVLGLFDIPLNLWTSLIAAITLGIAVDDTVHYFARFAYEARRLGDEVKATATTLCAVIRPVTCTTLGLCLGFLVLTVSDVRYQVQFGLLSAFTMAVAWALEMTLSPAICSRVQLVTLWDLLRIDLGREPQHSIPLFHDLSERQARIFALMARTVEVPAGKRLFSEGEKGSEMFVVIDGELVASTESDGKCVAFSRMRRGDVVGEIGLFSEGRTADVDVTQDARLLRFGEADLERVGRRYPRIGAKVYRNLNRILARRVVTTAQALR
jgi:predicted RND superfamily exporter protein